MTRRIFFGAMLAAFFGIGLAVSVWAANTNADYAGVPPFIGGNLPPNVLVQLDNGGTMGFRAYCDQTNRIGPPYAYNQCDAFKFDETQKYVGLFNPRYCYDYDANPLNLRFFKTGRKATISEACPKEEWDGNFLNWVSYRRIDAVKKSLIGGSCAGVRDYRSHDGACQPMGVPPLVTIQGQTDFGHNNQDEDGANTSSAKVPQNTTGGLVPGTASGRVPKHVQKAGLDPVNLIFHVQGTGAPMAGTFCVADAVDPPPGISTCDRIAGGFDEQEFQVRVVVDPNNLDDINNNTVDSNPESGAIWTFGDSARWGMIYSKGNTGGFVAVPIGNPQRVDYFDSGVTTYPSNKLAMVGAIEAYFSGKHSPIGNAMFEAMRYYAQTNAYSFPDSYDFPLGSTPGANFQSGGRGSAFGASEIAGLATGQHCPTKYPGTDVLIEPPYVTDACGRDPFFYGTFHGTGIGADGLPLTVTQSWVDPGSMVTCCMSFILVYTDGGFVGGDNAAPPVLLNYAAPVHGAFCDDFAATPTPDCPPMPAAMDPDLTTHHHKRVFCATCEDGHMADDIAYWGHTNDLRPDPPGLPQDPNRPVSDGKLHARNHMTGANPLLPTEDLSRGRQMPGFQNVTVYVVYAFASDKRREQLEHIALAGGFQDTDPISAVGQYMVPDKREEWDSVNNDTGEACGGPDQPACDGIPDTYFEAVSPDKLRGALNNAIQSILQRSASGTSISVLSTSTTGEGAVYQAYFYPRVFDNFTTQVKWTGYLQGLFVDKFGNLREDTDGDGKLILAHDLIVKMRYDEVNKKVLVDRYNNDGTRPDDPTVTLDKLHSIWEAGKRLALMADPQDNCAANTGGVNCRRILTWVDRSNDGIVDDAERIEFTKDNLDKLCPFLGSIKTLDSLARNPNAINCRAGGVNQAAALEEAGKIISFIRGKEVSGLRSRKLTVNGAPKVWKLGDIIYSTPVVVGAPRERFDVLYGDADYARYFRRYKDRRQVAYVGANDGMLHAFNAGFFTADDTQIDGLGDTVQVRFSVAPMIAGTSTPCSSLPCDGRVPTYPFRTDNPQLGSELWGFIPQDLLPHLQWLTTPEYDHVYYVDLKPKVTDARIFADDADHPGGWGTVLIGGFRLGGSCTKCTRDKAGPRTVAADFDGSGVKTRVFLSSYFVLDITNPEHDPKLLWVFRDQDLGLTTAAPAVMRIKGPNTAIDPKTNSAHEKWYVVFGTGPTHFDGSAINKTSVPKIIQKAQIFVVDLKTGPAYPAGKVNKTTGTERDTTCSVPSPCIVADLANPDQIVRAISTGQAGAFMGDTLTSDFDLDFRVDVIYVGSVSCNDGGGLASPCIGAGPMWSGAMWRLTTNGDPEPNNWGVSGGPTKLVSTFAKDCLDTTATCAKTVGPILAAPAMAMDDSLTFWIFFGTGRYFTASDKGNDDPQYFFGVKDCDLTNGCTDLNHERHNLFDVSNVKICKLCNISDPSKIVSLNGDGTYDKGFDSGPDSLLNTVGPYDGWFTALQSPRERSLTTPVLIGGSLFFTTFSPGDDICGTTADGHLYSLYYLTGTPYKESTIGTDHNGVANKSIDLGEGVPSGVAIQIGAQGLGDSGMASNTGCVGSLTGFTQSSTGAINQLCGSPALHPWSRILSWRDV